MKAIKLSKEDLTINKLRSLYEQYGEEMMACIILKDGDSMTEEELKAFVAASMARHKVPRYVDFVKNFPMNAAGKILKYKMREEAVEKLGLK